MVKLKKKVEGIILTLRSRNIFIITPSFSIIFNYIVNPILKRNQIYKTTNNTLEKKQ